MRARARARIEFHLSTWRDLEAEDAPAGRFGRGNNLRGIFRRLRRTAADGRRFVFSISDGNKRPIVDYRA